MAPLPISGVATRTVTMSSVPIEIHGVNSAPGRASVSTHGTGPRKAASAESTETTPRAMPPPNAGRSGGGLMDRRPHTRIGAAPADVIDVSVDIRVGRVGDILEQRRRRHQHAGLAIAALRHVHLDPQLLQRMT